MNRFSGQHPMNNSYGNNNMVNRFQKYVNNNVPFNNNPMLYNNPTFMGSVKDPQFYQRINNARNLKLDQIRRAKSINDLNLKKDQIVEYVIPTMKINKTSKEEIEKDYNDRMGDFKQLMEAWWNTRTNDPYKNILKNENYKKLFKCQNDLIVHKVTSIDKDRIRLDFEFDKLQQLLEKHNDELKIIYSASEESKHKKEFKYVNKYKYRLKHEVQNFEDLKEFYKQEQKKLAKEEKMIDNVIAMIQNIDINDRDDPDYNSKLQEIKKLSEEIDRSTQSKPTKKKEIDLDSLENELRKELGEKEYNKMLKELDEDDNKKEKQKPKFTTVTKNVKCDKIVAVESQVLSKYKNRKSKK